MPLVTQGVGKAQEARRRCSPSGRVGALTIAQEYKHNALNPPFSGV